MDKEKFHIRLKMAGLTEVNGDIIAQGFLDLDGIKQLKVGDYQREVLKGSGESQSRRGGIEIAVSLGARLPSIVLGMRGQNFRMSGDDMLLYDPVYTIDGLQRTFAMVSHAEKTPEDADKMMIGAEVRFATNKDMEKELFQILNTKRTPMSPNVIMRNMRDSNKAVLTLYGLSVSDHSSPLFERVQWQQRRNRGELITALSMAQVAEIIHRHVQVPFSKTTTGKGRSGSGRTGSGVAARVLTLDRRANMVGLKTFRENILEFFDTLDQVWGFTKIEYAELSPHLRGNFMQVLAQMFSDHEDFWSGDRLVVSTDHKRKLKSFRIDAPEVIRLAGGSNTTKPILYALLREHMDKGMKKNKLTPRRKNVVEMREAA